MWFKNLWQLAHHLKVTTELDSKYLLRPIRDNDRLIMGEFQRIGFKGSELSALKVVTNFKRVLHLSDIACYNGVTINNWALTSNPGKSTHTFPHKRPQPSDFTLWKDMIFALTHSELR